MMKKLLSKNILLFRLGNTMLVVCLLLTLYYPFNKHIVLSINSVVKPIKFALSIWLYSWTMALILNHVESLQKVKIFSWVAVVCMVFEQAAISFQALRGTTSHFNKENTFGMVLFSLMGLFILTITIWTGYIAYIFIKQKKYDLQPATVLSIKIGLIYFIIFSLFGGFISSFPGHTVGSVDGGSGIKFLNWSTSFGDLRVAHFFGIHSLQIVPMFAIVVNKYFCANNAFKATWLFSIFYVLFIIFVLLQSLLGIHFVS